MTVAAPACVYWVGSVSDLSSQTSEPATNNNQQLRNKATICRLETHIPAYPATRALLALALALAVLLLQLLSQFSQLYFPYFYK